MLSAHASVAALIKVILALRDLAPFVSKFLALQSRRLTRSFFPWDENGGMKFNTSPALWSARCGPREDIGKAGPSFRKGCGAGDGNGPYDLF